MVKASRKKAEQATGTNGAAPEGESVSGYFRKIFEANPGLLDSRSNDELLGKWLADHPGETVVPERIKQNLANIKSVLRKKLREPAKSKGTGKKLGRPAKTVALQEKQEKPAVSKASRGLERLEEEIDDCLTLAKHLDREGLGSVISHLRRARNDVVWRLGQ